MVRVRAAALAAAVFWLSPSIAQESGKVDAARGQQIATQVCAACHAADGNSTVSANPKLAGQFPEYLQKQLRNFQAQGGKQPQRVNAVMNGMAANLKEDEIKSLAAHYGSQKLKPALARDKDAAAIGQKIWRGGNPASGVAACAGCHGPAGAGIPAQYPRLAGQHPEYIDAQLKLFRAGTRANDANGMMRGVAARMTDAEIRAVSEYVAGLR